MAKTKAQGETQDFGQRRRAAGQAAARELVSKAAHELFRDKGYEAVTLEEIANVCGISVRTLLRYFPNKESIALSRARARLERFEALLSAHEGKTLEYWRRHVMEEILVSAEDGGEAVRTLSRIIAASPTLRAYSADIAAQYENLLARALAEENDDWGFSPRILAAMLVAGNLAARQHWVSGVGPIDPELHLKVIDFVTKTVPAHFPKAAKKS